MLMAKSTGVSDGLAINVKIPISCLVCPWSVFCLIGRLGATETKLLEELHFFSYNLAQKEIGKAARSEAEPMVGKPFLT